MFSARSYEKKKIVINKPYDNQRLFAQDFVERPLLDKAKFSPNEYFLIKEEKETKAIG